MKSSNLKSMNINSKGNKKIKLNESREQNLMGSVELLERQVGSVGQPDMVYKKSSISHSGCGMGSHKSFSIVDSKEKRKEQLSLHLSPSLSHSKGDR